MAGNVSPNPDRTQYTPAEQQRNRRTLYIAGGIAAGVIVLCCVIAGIAAAVSSAGSGHTGTTAPQVVHKSTNIPAPPTATSKPKVWTVVQSFKGNGEGQTATFTMSANDWRLVWSCDSSSFYGSTYNVIIDINYSDGTSTGLAGVNIICSKSNTSGTIEVHNVTGDLYLAVISEAVWTAKVEVLQ